jgi:hypothetical protein
MNKLSKSNTLIKKATGSSNHKGRPDLVLFLKCLLRMPCVSDTAQGTRDIINNTRDSVFIDPPSLGEECMGNK